VAISKDGKYVVSGGMDPIVRLFENSWSTPTVTQTSSVTEIQISTQTDVSEKTSMPTGPIQTTTGVLSTEALAVIIGIVMTSVGSAVGWHLKTGRKRRLGTLLDKVDKLYLSFKENTGKCESALYDFKDLVASDLKQGRIDESSFQILDNRIDKYLAEVKSKKTK
jgi:hypothetical protein